MLAVVAEVLLQARERGAEDEVRVCRVWEAIEARIPRAEVRSAVATVTGMVPPPEAVPDGDWRAELAARPPMLTATITFGATAEGVPVLAAMTALGEQLAADTRWNARNPLIRPEVVPGPWKHLVFGHPARRDGSVDYGAYIFCVLEQFCRHLETAGDLRRGLHQVPQPAGTRSLAQALLTAGAATGGSANLLGQIIGAGTERATSALDGKQRDDEDDSTRQ